MSGRRMNIVTGDLVASVQAGVILHQVNCQGVMGSGVAKALRDRYPQVWEQYKLRCSAFSDQELLGQAQLVQVSSELYVANLFGQRFYGRESRRYTSYDALDEALKTVAWMLSSREMRPHQCHHPLIGCGLGGGNWSVVKALIQQHLPNSTLWVLGDLASDDGK